MADGTPMKPGFYNIDCMEAMKLFPDQFFDLAIVDPPYGDGNSKIGGGMRFGQRFDRYKEAGTGLREVLPSGNTRTWTEPEEHGLKSTGKKS